MGNVLKHAAMGQNDKSIHNLFRLEGGGIVEAPSSMFWCHSYQASNYTKGPVGHKHQASYSCLSPATPH